MLRSVTVFLTLLGVAATCPGRVFGNKIADISMKITTTSDNREGGVVEVSLWQDGRCIAKFEDPEKVWADGQEVKLSGDNLVKNKNLQPALPVEARIKLTDGNEVNISWKFDIEVSAFDEQGKKLFFQKRGMSLDTSGRGRPRSSEQVIGTVNAPAL